MKTRHEMCQCGDASVPSDTKHAKENGGYSPDKIQGNSSDELGLDSMMKGQPKLSETSRVRQIMTHESCMDEYQVVATTLNLFLFFVFSAVFFIGCIAIFLY